MENQDINLILFNNELYISKSQPCQMQDVSTLEKIATSIALRFEEIFKTHFNVCFLYDYDLIRIISEDESIEGFYNIVPSSKAKEHNYYLYLIDEVRVPIYYMKKNIFSFDKFI